MCPVCQVRRLVELLLDFGPIVVGRCEHKGLLRIVERVRGDHFSRGGDEGAVDADRRSCVKVELGG
jgi:hypothetical protein